MTDRSRGRPVAPPRPASPALTLELRIQFRRWRELPDLRERVAQAIDAALSVAAVKPLQGAELSLLLTDDRRMRAVNRDWRGIDKATNVLSFPAAPPDRIATSPVLGDIAIAYETVAREAEEEGKAIGDHLSHLVIHGLLHLLGEDHETDDEAHRMEGCEIAALALLGIADPYADSEPDTDEPAGPDKPATERHLAS